MLLVDSKPLETDALNEKLHKLHDFAVEYDNALKELHQKYPNGFIRFKRTGFPKHVKGADSNFNEIPKVAEPVPVMRVPLKTNVALGRLGKHTIACCVDTPTILPNGLWDLGRTKSMSIKEDLLINFKNEPDLAFFFYKVSPFVNSRRGSGKGLLRVVDPVKDDELIGQEARELTETKYAVWSMLSDVDKLKTMARAYGVAGVDTKQPNAIRKELEALLIRNDNAKRSNPAIKGTKEFVDEMKVTDSLLLRNFVQKCVDDRKIECRADGRWHLGEKILIQVPVGEMKREKEYLCNYLMTGNNFEKLQGFMRDLISKEYLDAIPENKDGKKEWEWLAKIAEFNPQFKKISEIKDNTTRFFCPTL